MSAPTNQTAARRPAAPKASSRVTQYVDQQLERTRRQVKSTDLIAAGLLLVVMVIGFFLLAAIIDAWVFTLTPMMRWIAFLGLIAGCVSMLVFSIWPLLTKKINPDYAAKMLEDSKPGFRNSVLNYVWFRKKPDGIRSAVFDAVARQAAVDLNSVPADSSVDRSKVIRLGFWLVGMTAAFIVYFMLSPKNPFQTLNRVMFPAADLAKPAVVTIADVTPGNTSVFFGDQVEITAKVYGQHSPEDVQLIYSTNDGRQSGQVMVMQPDPTTPRQYKIDLTKNTGGLRESLEYEIVARDGQTGKFEIKVAPRPAITIESIQIQPPKYTKLKPQTTLQGAIDGVEGATVILRATANLEIENATIELLNQLPTAPNEDQKFKLAQAPLDMKVESKSAQRTFQLTLDSNREKPMATHYRLNFRSVTGKSPATPNVYPIRIIPDLAPELEVRNPTAPESKVPANGRLAVVATANDLDYEISFIQINVEHRGNQIRSKKLPLKIQAENGRKAQARFEIKPEELGLSVGDQAIFYLTHRQTVTPEKSPISPATSKKMVRVVIRRTTATQDPMTTKGQMKVTRPAIKVIPMAAVSQVKTIRQPILSKRANRTKVIPTNQTKVLQRPSLNKEPRAPAILKQNRVTLRMPIIPKATRTRRPRPRTAAAERLSNPRKIQHPRATAAMNRPQTVVIPKTKATVAAATNGPVTPIQIPTPRARGRAAMQLTTTSAILRRKKEMKT